MTGAQTWALPAFRMLAFSQRSAYKARCGLINIQYGHQRRNRAVPSRGFVSDDTDSKPRPKPPAALVVENIFVEAMVRSNLPLGDVQKLYGRFQELSGGKGYFTRDDMASVMLKFGLDDPAMGTHLFDAFDRDGDNALQFTEILAGLLRINDAGHRVPQQILNEGHGAQVLWERPAQTLVIIKKWHDEGTTIIMKEMVDWLVSRGLRVLVEPQVVKEFPDLEAWDFEQHTVDFMISLGGDGTLLHLSSLFKHDQVIPPVLPFGTGSLGFMTPFEAKEFVPALERVLEQKVRCNVTLRTRLRCEVRPTNCDTSEPVLVKYVLNECLLDRGDSPHLGALDCFVDDQYLTTIQADGLIVSTPTGSTAYNMSAGGAMCSPTVPCLLLTPVAPHSLSFRPLVLSDNSRVSVRLPQGSRTGARCSFDGRDNYNLQEDETIHLTKADCPVPVINMNMAEGDWFEGITRKLHWNKRTMQKPLQSSGLNRPPPA